MITVIITALVTVTMIAAIRAAHDQRKRLRAFVGLIEQATALHDRILRAVGRMQHEANKSLVERSRWCVANATGRYWVDFDDTGELGFHFKLDEDAMLYRLRWLGE